MIFLFETWEVIRDFLEAGGDVLLVIGLATLILWTLILEKYYYFIKIYPAESESIIKTWMSRQDRSSWAAHRIREALISDAGVNLDRSVGFIKTMVAVCPLLCVGATVDNE